MTTCDGSWRAHDVPQAGREHEHREEDAQVRGRDDGDGGSSLARAR